MYFRWCSRTRCEVKYRFELGCWVLPVGELWHCRRVARVVVVVIVYSFLFIVVWPATRHAHHLSEIALSAMHASRSHYLRDCLIDDYPICIAFASCFLRIIVRLPCYVRTQIQLRGGKPLGKNLKAPSKWSS